MKKVYRLHWISNLVFIFVALGGLFFIFLFFMGKVDVSRFLLALVSVPLAVLFIFIRKNVCIIISDKSIIYSHPFRFLRKEIEWSKVSRVKSYNLFGFLRAYGVYPKGGAISRNNIVSFINIAIPGYKEAIRNIVLLSNPDTIIDQRVLKEVQLVDADIGKNYIPEARHMLSNES